MGQAVEDRPDDDTGQEMHVQKAVHTLIAVTPGHTLTGDVHISEGAELARYIESPEPLFIPMTDVRTRSLADRRIIARYAFALLNRRHMVAATELQPGMIRVGRSSSRRDASSRPRPDSCHPHGSTSTGSSVSRAMPTCRRSGPATGIEPVATIPTPVATSAG